MWAITWVLIGECNPSSLVELQNQGRVLLLLPGWGSRKSWTAAVWLRVFCAGQRSWVCDVSLPLASPIVVSCGVICPESNLGFFILPALGTWHCWEESNGWMKVDRSGADAASVADAAYVVLQIALDAQSRPGASPTPSIQTVMPVVFTCHLCEPEPYNSSCTCLIKLSKRHQNVR